MLRKPNSWSVYDPHDAGGDKKPLWLDKFDVSCRCFADLFINFVYPIFLFMVFPIFVALSTSYMGAISAATGVFFAVQWDAESCDVDLVEVPRGRGEASA